MVLLGLFAGSSCEQLQGVKDDAEREEKVATEQDTVEEQTEEPEPETPEWYNAASPVRAEGDSLYVTVSAVSVDSTDARHMAYRSISEYSETAFTGLLVEILDSREEDIQLNSSVEEKEEMIAMLTYDGSEVLSGIPYSESEFYYQSERQVRFYLKRAWHKTDALEAAKSSLSQ